MRLNLTAGTGGLNPSSKKRPGFPGRPFQMVRKSGDLHQRCTATATTHGHPDPAKTEQQHCPGGRFRNTGNRIADVGTVPVRPGVLHADDRIGERKVICSAREFQDERARCGTAGGGTTVRTSWTGRTRRRAEVDFNSARNRSRIDVGIGARRRRRGQINRCARDIKPEPTDARARVSRSV